jgi:hypothetical protein
MSKEINLPQKVEILRTFKHLGIVEVSSKTQKKNGTRRFRMPFKLDGRENVEFAVYKSGYVRKTKGFVFACYQINQTRKSTQRYFKVTSGQHKGYYYKFADGRERILINSETERLQYLLDFLVRNYFKA